MGVQLQITDTDRGQRRIMTQMRALAREEITVGVHGTGATGRNERGQSVTVKDHTGAEGPIAMPQLAAIHEFGTAKIPERSFIRSAVDENKAKYQRAYNKGVEAILDGTGTAIAAANLVGVIMVGSIRTKIFDGIAPELAASTKKMRDKSKLTGKRLKSGNTTASGYTPLLDSGQLAGSLAYQTKRSKERHDR